MNICVRRVIATVAFASTLIGLAACSERIGILPSGSSRPPTGGGATRTALSTGTSFTFTTIDVPGAFYTSPYGINDSGDIVGIYGDSSSPQHGFLDVGGVFTTIDYPGAPCCTLPHGINDSGEIVGTYNAGDIGGRGFLYVGGTFSTINFPDALVTEVRAINNNGVIVGDYSINSCFSCPGRGGSHSNFTHGFVDVGGSFNPFDHPTAFSTWPRGINVNREIVGSWEPRACFCTLPFLAVGHDFTAIFIPGAYLIDPTGINDNAEIVGDFLDASGEHGFLDVGGVITTFDAPTACSPLPCQTEPLGINNNGMIVGTAGGSSGGFLATPTK